MNPGGAVEVLFLHSQFWKLACRNAIFTWMVIFAMLAGVEVAHASKNKSHIEDVCRRISMAAGMWTLPAPFLARLIWKESRFDPNAISPVGASGIAQFMPATARFRGLEDPFDLRVAIPASAHYLYDLKAQFGNLGLAAAAYNAGPGRVQEWLSGTKGLPYETIDFVTTITGYPPTAWASPTLPDEDYSLDKNLSFEKACLRLPVKISSPRTEYSKASWQPWGAHLTADWSQGKALEFYRRLQQRFPKILDKLVPMVIRTVNPSFGSAPRYEIRIGQPDRKRAVEFCSKMRAAGGVCLVTKTESR